MLLYLVRHGESTFNAEGRIQGRLDVPLSEFGRQQSAAVAAALARLSIDAIYASPLRRARETAAPIAGRHGLLVQTDPRLMEIDVGVFQGRLRREVQQEYPQELARWHSEDLDYALPGGESRRNLMRRGRAALEAVVKGGHACAIVVAHGRLLTTTMKDLLGVPSDEPPFALHNGSITTLACRSQGRWELVSLDRVDHLDGIGLGSKGDL